MISVLAALSDYMSWWQWLCLIAVIVLIVIWAVMRRRT